MNDVYLFTHIPKTAGTTLRYHFQKHLKDQVDFIHFANKGNNNAIKSGLTPFESRSLSERQRAQVVLGHNVNKDTKSLFEGNKVNEIIFFRDPVGWEISRYNQYANARILKNQLHLPFKQWFPVEKIHSQFDWFLINYCGECIHGLNENQKLEMVHSYLAGFYKVCHIDDLVMHMAPIFNKLGIPSEMKSENVTGMNKKVNVFNDDPTNRSFLNQQLEKELAFFNNISKIFDR